MTLIKSISGIRGTIGGVPGDNLTPIDIVKFATAYVRFLSEKSSGRRLTVVVGRDARISGAMVDDLIEGTLLGCGVDVINVGLCTTPGTEMAVIANNADGGIIITAPMERFETARRARRVSERCRRQARSGSGRGYRFRVSRHRPHRPRAQPRAVQRRAYTPRAGAAAGRCRRRARAPRSMPSTP